MQIENLGWNGFFAVQQCPGIPARVATASRDRFIVWTETGEAEAVVRGQLRRSGPTWPAVGDWVALRPGTTVIEHVFERRTLLSRKQPGKPIQEQVLAANIDVLFIVTGLDHDFNERRLERFPLGIAAAGLRTGLPWHGIALRQSLGARRSAPSRHL